MLCITKGFKFFLPQQKSVSYKNKTSFGLIHSTAEKFLWKLNAVSQGYVHGRRKMSYQLKVQILEGIEVGDQFT